MLYLQVYVQIIIMSFNCQDDVTVSEDCVSGRGIRASYELNYTTDSGTHITTCVGNGTECSNGTCHHELQSNAADSRCQPPVSQFSGEYVTVSVTARNIAGRSNSSVSRNISEFFSLFINTNRILPQSYSLYKFFVPCLVLNRFVSHIVSGNNS